jgi:hypothetical protein
MIRAQGAIVGWTATCDQIERGAAWMIRCTCPPCCPTAGARPLAALPRGGGDQPLATGEPAIALLRYAPGAGVPAHLHPGMETILVLEGAQSDDRGRYPAGSLVVNPEGTAHSRLVRRRLRRADPVEPPGAVPDTRE